MKNVIIVGGGLSGLCAGIYCRKNGLNCTVLEKNSFAGGNLTGWYRNGCYIDNCFHWLTGTFPGSSLYRIWRDIDMIGDRTSLYQGNTFYESELNGERIAFSRYPEVTRLNMLKLSPEDRKQIDRFIDCAEAVGELMTDNTASLGIASAYMHYRGITLDELGKKFKHPLLRIAFSDYICGDFSAITLIWAYAAFISGNGMIPYGGSRNAAIRIENRYKELGGRIRLSTEVDRIVISGDHALGVTTVEGEYIRSDAVICCCAPDVTFGKLIPKQYMTRDFARLYGKEAEAKCFSSIQAAYVIESRKLPHFGTRVIDGDIRVIGGNGRIVAREYTHEPGYAPNGQTVLQLMVFLSEAECDDWIKLSYDRNGYQNRKRECADAFTYALLRAFPMIAQEVAVLLDIWTPATYNRYFSARHGAYMGFELTPKVSLKRYSPFLKGIDNVFMASQWQCAPGGLPNAARSGKIAAEKVTKLLSNSV